MNASRFVAACTSLDDVYTLLGTSASFDFSRFPRETVRRRVERRMRALGAVSSADYVDELRSDGIELHRLQAELLGSGTAFFRDREAWEFLAHHVLPAVVRDAD